MPFYRLVHVSLLSTLSIPTTIPPQPIDIFSTFQANKQAAKMSASPKDSGSASGSASMNLSCNFAKWESHLLFLPKHAAVHEIHGRTAWRLQGIMMSFYSCWTFYAPFALQNWYGRIRTAGRSWKRLTRCCTMKQRWNDLLVPVQTTGSNTYITLYYYLYHIRIA